MHSGAGLAECEPLVESSFATAALVAKAQLFSTSEGVVDEGSNGGIVEGGSSGRLVLEQQRLQRAVVPMKGMGQGQEPLGADAVALQIEIAQRAVLLQRRGERRRRLASQIVAGDVHVFQRAIGAQQLAENQTLLVADVAHTAQARQPGLRAAIAADGQVRQHGVLLER